MDPQIVLLPILRNQYPKANINLQNFMQNWGNKMQTISQNIMH